MLEISRLLLENFFLFCFLGFRSSQKLLEIIVRVELRGLYIQLSKRNLGSHSSVAFSQFLKTSQVLRITLIEGDIVGEHLIESFQERVAGSVDSLAEPHFDAREGKVSFVEIKEVWVAAIQLSSHHFGESVIVKTLQESIAGRLDIRVNFRRDSCFDSANQILPPLFLLLSRLSLKILFLIFLLILLLYQPLLLVKLGEPEKLSVNLL